MNREKEIVKTSVVGILGNALLVGTKIAIGLISKSFAIVTDAINNLTDAVSSVVTIVGTKLSNKKPDRKHPFGYGQVEYITSFLISVIILLAGGTAIIEAIQQLIKGSETSSYSTWSLIVIAVGVVIKFSLGIYFRIRGKKLNSQALLGSGMDAISDSILSLSTLVVAVICVFVPQAYQYHLENYLSILIGLFIIKAGIDVMIDSASSIIGGRTEQELINNIKKLVNTFPEVHGAYDLAIHTYGPNKIIGSVHVQVDDDLTAKEIHHLTKQIQEKAYAEYGVILTVGVYASNDSEPLYKQMKDYAYKLVKNIKGIVQLHGFYVDEDSKNVTFDIIFEYKIKEDKQAIITNISNEMKKQYPDYNFSIIEDLNISD